MSGPFNTPRLWRVHMVALSIVMTGGALGGIANVLIRPIFELVRLAGPHGLLMHGHLPFTKAAMYTQIVWGALWGIMLALPAHKIVRNFWARAFLFGVPPSLVALLIVLPAHDKHAGVFSLGLGAGMPLLVLLANTVGWSVPAYMWIAACGASEGSLGVPGEGDAPLLG